MSDPSRAARQAGVVAGVHALLVAAATAFYAYELTIGEASDVGRAVSSMVLFLVVAVGLGAVARGLVRGQTWPRTPLFVWSVLWLPVAWTLLQSSQPLLGAAVGAFSVLTVVVTLRVPVPDRGPDADQANA